MDCGHSSSQPGTHFLAICCCCCCIPYSTAAGVKRRLASVPQHPMAHPASLEAHRWLRERLHARERSLAAPVGAVPCSPPLGALKTPILSLDSKPTVVNDAKDAIHNCPYCAAVVGTKKLIGS